jgi:hypothetical protein
MRRVKLFRLLVVLIACALLVGCGPMVSINNRTNVGVRAVVFAAGQRKQVTSVSPGESSTVELSGAGKYTVGVIQDKEWVDWIKLTRKVLGDLLAQPDRLTPEQIKDVTQKLRGIDAKLTDLQRSSGAGATCSGTVSVDASMVEVRIGQNGQFVMTCGGQ